MTLAPRAVGSEDGLRPIPFARLVRAEWSKAIDTRSARWLFVLVALTTVGAATVPVMASSNFDQTQSSYLRVVALGLTILLPVIAILMLTGEWTQRSVMTTFIQEPRRFRVMGAKVAASTLLGFAGSGFGGVVAAIVIGLASASGRDLDANLSVGLVVGYVAFVLLNVLSGVALGALLQNSGTAIAASFVLPATFAVVGSASKFVGEWIDISTWNWVLVNDWNGHVLQVACSISLWIVVPLAAGLLRAARRDVA